jgi:ribose transport system permease protein
MEKETLTEAIAMSKAPEEKPSSSRGTFLWMANNGIFVFTALLIISAAFLVDGFASLQNITDVFHRAAPIGIVAAGMTFVVIH